MIKLVDDLSHWKKGLNEAMWMNDNDGIRAADQTCVTECVCFQMDKH